MKKLYVIVRADLSPGLQLAQVCHAQGKFAHEHPTLYRTWFDGENNIAVLHVADEQALCSLVLQAKTEHVSVSWFREPDLGGALTAIALGDEGRKLARHLPSAFKERQAA